MKRIVHFAAAATTKSKKTKAEAAYADRLRRLEYQGKIILSMFEPLNLRLGQKLYYKPDFLVINAQSQVEFHEVKTTWSDGRPGWTEDSRVKIKAAASRFPFFRFRAAIYDNGQWHIETIPGPDEAPRPKEPKA